MITIFCCLDKNIYIINVIDIYINDFLDGYIHAVVHKQRVNVISTFFKYQRIYRKNYTFTYRMR